LGRFLQSDPIGFGGGDANLYRYCDGDPVNGSDPLGLLASETFVFYLKRPNEAKSGFVNHAMDWGPIDQVMQYMGGGDHGWFGGGFHGLSDGGSVGTPLDRGTVLKIEFYLKYGSAFDNAFRQRAGYVLDIPPQNLGN